MAFLIYPCGCKFELQDSSLKEDIVVDNKLKEYPAIKLDLNNIDLNCNHTWDLISEGNTTGVFQVETRLGSMWCKKIQPHNIDELSLIIAILRPGCLESFMEDGKNLTHHCCERKHGREEVIYLNDTMKEILKDTYGIFVYQEESILTASKVAGMNLQQADSLRKAIGKKDTELMAKLEKEFVEGCKNTGIVTEEQGKDIFETIRASQRYQFNRCVSSNTKLCGKQNSIRFQFYPTILEMYNIRNDIEYAKRTGHLSLHRKWKRIKSYGSYNSLCTDERIRPNILKDIRFAGYKNVYKVITEENKSIVCTLNHKFPTQRGELTLSKIKVGDSLYICGDYEKDKSKTYSFSDFTKEERIAKQKSRKFKSGKNTHGELNSRYTNGSFTDFINNKELLPKECQICGKLNNRMEIHHIDGNRKDSSLQNLMKVCVSCHKKLDYKLGRIRKGQRGYPSYLSKIISIEPVGKEAVFDVEMEGPNHNFVIDNGIVTSNSHSISYAMVGYYTAFCKTHFPLQFYASYLKGAIWKQKPLDEIKTLVNDAKKQDISVLPPDIRNLKKEFYIEGKNIRFGISEIKNIGMSAVETILRHLQTTVDKLEKPISEWRWIEFLVFCSQDINNSAYEALISCGACDCFGIGRRRMIYELKIYNMLSPGERTWIQEHFMEIKGNSLVDILESCGKVKKEGGGCHNQGRADKLLKLKGELENPPHSTQDNILTIAQEEEKYLGIALTVSKVDGRADAEKATHTIKDFIGSRDKYGILAVEMGEIKIIHTKKGKNPGQEMAFVNLSDNSGSIDGAVCFPNVFAENGELLYEANTLLMQVERNTTQEGFLINKLWQI
jgi:5-methylcytosine-specific restriction endonuclease McrA